MTGHAVIRTFGVGAEAVAQLHTFLAPSDSPWTRATHRGPFSDRRPTRFTEPQRTSPTAKIPPTEQLDDLRLTDDVDVRRARDPLDQVSRHRAREAGPSYHHAYMTGVAREEHRGLARRVSSTHQGAAFPVASCSLRSSS